MERKERKLVPLCTFCKKEGACMLGPKYKKCNDITLKLGHVVSTSNTEWTKAPELLSKRPSRSTVIGKEDISNLKIALNSCKSLEEFVQLI